MPKRITLYSIFLLLFTLTAMQAHCQQYLIENDTLHINICSEGVGGGQIMAYSNPPYRSYSGWIIIEGLPGDTLTLDGIYGIWDANLSIWDGLPSAGGTQLVDYTWVGSGSLALNATSGIFFIWFHTDTGDDEQFDFTWGSMHHELCCAERPSNLTVGTTVGGGGTCTALLNWQTSAPANTHYRITLDDVPVDTVAATTATLHGLTASMQHEVEVSIIESGSCGFASIRKIFRTPCTGVSSLPFHENFDDVAIDSIPPCWFRAMNFDNLESRPRVVGDFYNSRPRSLMIGCGANDVGGHFSIVTTPKISNAGPWNVSLRMKATHENTRLVIGIADTAIASLAASGFVPLDTIVVPTNTGWVHQSISLSGSLAGKRLALMMQQSMQDGILRLIYIDDLRVEECGVDSLTAYRIMSDSITLAWNTIGNPTCNLRILRLGTPQYDTILAGVTSPIQIGNLSPSTRYTFTVIPICNGTYTLPLSTTTRTADLIGANESICENMQSAIPYGWSAIKYSFSDNAGNSAGDIHAGNYLMSPNIPIAGRTVSFIRSTTYAGMTLVVGTMQYPDDTSTFTPIASFFYDDEYLWHSELVHIPNNTTDHYIAFKAEGGPDYYCLHIRNVRIGNYPLLNVHAAHIRGTTAELRWNTISDSGCDSVIVEYGPRSYTFGTGQRDTVVNSSRITIHGLQTDTDYDFFAWRPCDGDPCDFRIQIRTSREDYPLPYCEDFYGMDYVWEYWAGDWRRPNTLYNTPQITHHPWYYGAEQALELGSYGFMDSYYSTAVMPDVEIDSNTILSFYATASTPTSYLVLGMQNEYTDNQFHAFDTITVSDNRQHYVYPLPDSLADAEGRIAMRWWHPVQYSYHRIYIDELQLAHNFYNNVTPTYVGFDTAAFTYTDSVRLTLIGGGDTLTLSSPNLSTGDLDTGTLYLMYVMPLTDSNSCLSYAGYFVTAAYGGHTGCYTFDELQDTILPNGWYFSGNARIDNGTLIFNALAVMPPLGDISDNRLTLRKPNTDTLFVGYTIDSITYTITDTITSTQTVFYLPAMPANAHLALYSADTARIDMIGISGCRIVHFTTDGGRVICTVDGGSTEYLLTVTDTADSSEYTFYITESPFIINSLLMSHTYNFSYQCIGDYSDCSIDTIITITDSLALPYCVSFEITNNGTGIPRNWTYYYDLDIIPSLELGWGETPLRFGEWDRLNQKTVLPVFNHTGAASVKMRIHTWSEASFQIGTVDATGDTSTFVPIVANRYTGWEILTAQIDSLGGRRIAFRSDNLVLIDYISISEIPKVTFSLIGWRTMRLTADTDDTNVDYYVRYRRDDGRDSVMHITTNPYYFVEEEYNDIYLTVAQDSTGYICGRENDRWQLSHLKEFPICQQEDYWDWYYRAYGDSWTDNYLNVGSHLMRINSDPNNYAYRLMPDINIDSIRHLTMRFDLNADRIGELIEVGVMSDAYDTGSFTPIDTFQYIYDHNRWQSCTTDFSGYTGDGRWIAFRHRSGQCSNCDDNKMLALRNYLITDCPAATATASLVRWNRIQIDATAPGFFVEYKNVDIPWDKTIVKVSQLPMILTLQGGATYDFYFRCDSIGEPCNPQRIHTGTTPLELPICIDFDTTAPAALNGWSLSDTSTTVDNGVMHLFGIAATPDINIGSLQDVGISLWYKPDNVSDRLYVGTMVNPSDPQTFWSASTLASQDTGTWSRFLIDLSASPSNAHFIAFKGKGKIDNIRIDTSMAHAFTVVQVEHNSITLVWNGVGNPATTLTVKQGDNVLHTYTNPTSPITIDGLTHLAPYTFLFASRITDTGICSMHYSDSAKIITPNVGTGCINTTDLHSPSALFTSGTYNNPYAVAGAVDYGYSHPDSRHTICYDTSARDPNTVGQLRMVPQNATSSVRLGNPSTDMVTPQSESVTYSLLVDTASFEIILLRYAAVLQDPMHAPSDQPRFRIEVLDSTFTPIDPECTSADFIADAALDWNVAPNNVLWKDWTSVGIDLTAYAGQQVFVRLTTFDCNEGSHFGYAYFTLNCMRKTLETAACGAADSNTFTAPDGFNYRWYSDQNTDTISTDQSITRPTADITYYCDLTKIDNENCRYTINVYGGTRFPMASFDTTVQIANCSFHVDFTNTSSVSADGINPIAGEQCENAYWDFGNGTTSTNYHGQCIYDNPGTYTVTLVSSIAGGTCADTTVFTLTLDYPPHTPRIEGPATLCFSDLDTLRIYDAHPDGDTSWTASGGHWEMPLSPTNYNIGDNTFSLQSVDDYGCIFDLSHIVKVNPTYTHINNVHLCAPLLPYRYPDTIFLPGTTTAEYHNILLSSDGCDSSYHLWLTVTEADDSTVFDTISASICDNQSYPFFGTDYTIGGNYLNVHVNDSGLCDSIHTLILNVRATSATDTTASECNIFSWYGNQFSTDTIASRSTYNIANCDSVITLHLDIRHSSDTNIHHYVVENNLPYLWNGLIFANDTTGCIVNLHNNEDCDSTINFSLTVYRNSDTSISGSLCEGNLPIMWNGVTFALGEEDPITHVITHTTTIHTIHGADSLLTMNLLVLYNSANAIHDTLLQNNLPTYTPPVTVPVVYTQNELDPSLVSLIDTTIVFTNAVGCDSTVHYTLHIWRNYNIADSAVRCDNQLPFSWNGVNFYSDSTATITFSSATASDSVVTFHLIVNPSYDTTDTLLICPHRPYIYDSIDYGGPGVYDIIYTTSLGCDSISHVTLMPRDTSFLLSPEVSLNKDHSTRLEDESVWLPYDTTLLGCLPSLLQLQDTSTSVSRTWTFWNTSGLGDTVSDTTALFGTDIDTMGIFGFQLIAISPEGCHDTVGNDTLLFVFNNPTADFIWEPGIVPFHDPTLTLRPTATPTDSLTYRWLIALDTQGGQYDTLQNDEGTNGLWTYSWEPLIDSGHYDVALIAYWEHSLSTTDTLTLSVACTDTAHYPVQIVNTYLQFPSLVTPNGDGVNDTWEVVNLVEMGEYPLNEVWIYNQWGILIFHARNIRRHDECWDPNTTNSPDGTYFFRFSGKGRYGIVKHNGVIEVLRD